MRRARRLGGEPRLADPRLAGDEHHLPLAVLRLRPREGERLRLSATADHRERRPRPEPGRQRQACMPERLPRNGAGHDRLGQALQRDRPDRREGVAAAPARREAHEVGHEDLPALRRRTEPRRLDHGGPKTVALLPGDVAETDPDAHREWYRERRAARATVVPVNGLLDRHRRSDSIGRAREGRHDPVADVLRHGPAVRRDCIREQPVVRASQRLGRLLAELRALRRRADEVGEEDRGGGGVRIGRLRRHRLSCLPLPGPQGQGRPLRPLSRLSVARREEGECTNLDALARRRIRRCRRIVECAVGGEARAPCVGIETLQQHRLVGLHM